MNDRNINDWDPENLSYWQKKGKKLAWKNLFWSSMTLVVAFMVWMFWSAFVVYLGQIRNDFTLSQLYWLTALPLISAGFLRLFYSFTVPIFGGRNWTVFATAIMALPMLGTYYGLAQQSPYALYVLLALATGTAGANFASSSANISFFFPHRYKGIALGINASIGNLGVGVIQWLVPWLIASQLGSYISLGDYLVNDDLAKQAQVIPLFLMTLVLIATLAAWFGMNNIKLPRSSFNAQKSILSNKHCWIMSLLYTFTFGTFIGFATVMPLLLSSLFNRLDFALYALSGATLSSVIRPLSNVLARYTGAVKLTQLSFLIMITALVLMLSAIPSLSHSGSFTLFIVAYMMIFVGTGIGKGSTTSMIPEIYQVQALKLQVQSPDLATTIKSQANTNTASVLGISSAIATFGAVLIPQAFDFAQHQMNNISLAIMFFIAANLVCLVATWWFYLRKSNDNPLCVEDTKGNRVIVDRPDLHALITTSN